MLIDQLARAYAAKTDEELLHLASQSHELTLEAEAALKSELARRRIDCAGHFRTRESHEHTHSAAVGISPLTAEPTGVAAFVAEALSVYHSQFWLFIKLIVPAVTLGVFTVFIGRKEAKEILRHVPRGIEVLTHRTELFESMLAVLAGFFGSWLAFSFAFGAISVAVQRLAQEQIPSVSECYGPVREGLRRLVGLSALLFILMLIVQGTASFLESGVMWVFARQHLRVSSIAIWLMSYGFGSMGVLLLSRFALSVPAVVLDGLKIANSIFRSDEYTERSWLILAALLGKSIVGGYVAGMLPFWFAQSVLVTVPLPSWFPWVLTAVSIAAVSVVEPTMFIGFTLLYLKRAKTASVASVAVAGGQPA